MEQGYVGGQMQVMPTRNRKVKIDGNVIGL